jgi:F-type H+-transporting ATPase subunit alpha
MLKQPQYQPMPMEEQVVSIFACTPREGRPSWVREYEISDLQRYEKEMLEYLRDNHADVLGKVRETGVLDEETEKKLVAALDRFSEVFQPSQGGAESDAA